MVPVDDRVVEADLQPLGAERVDVFAHDVAPERRVRRLVVGVLRVEEAEALVVLRREDDVFHAGPLRGPRPFARVEALGVEVLEVVPVPLLGDLGRALEPLVPRRERVEAEVDEHPESVMLPPGEALELLLPRLVRQPLHVRRLMRLERDVAVPERHGPALGVERRELEEPLARDSAEVEGAAPARLAGVGLHGPRPVRVIRRQALDDRRRAFVREARHAVLASGTVEDLILREADERLAAPGGGDGQGQGRRRAGGDRQALGLSRLHFCFCFRFHFLVSRFVVVLVQVKSTAFFPCAPCLRSRGSA